MGKFEISENREGGELKLSILGPLDEHADFDRVDFNEIQALTFSFQAVEFVNSAGILRWVTFMKDLVEKHPEVKITFSECTTGIVHQMNMVSSFLPKTAEVESFMVPFFCEKCMQNETVLYKFGVEVNTENGEVTHPKVMCSKCKKEMEIDVIEASYFVFAKR